MPPFSPLVPDSGYDYSAVAMKTAATGATVKGTTPSTIKGARVASAPNEPVTMSTKPEPNSTPEEHALPIPLGAALRSRYDAVMARVAAAAARSGRRASDISVVAVTKHASMEQVRDLLSFGHADLGENRVQQLIQRAALVDEQLLRRRERPNAVLPNGSAAEASTPVVRWHLIGTLQRNKVKKAIEIVRLVHSVDSLRLAEEIQECCQRRSQPVDVLVEVNVSGERSKHGVAPAAARHVVEMIDTMIHLRARGLMCMAPENKDGSIDPVEARRTFERCAELFEEIKASRVGNTDAGLRFDILSMGMSGDFEAAIECGANMVRVGSAIFGDHAPRLESPED